MREREHYQKRGDRGLPGRLSPEYGPPLEMVGVVSARYRFSCKHGVLVDEEIAVDGDGRYRTPDLSRFPCGKYWAEVDIELDDGTHMMAGPDRVRIVEPL